MVKSPKNIHNIAILGFSKEGKAALQYLQNSPHYKGAHITICDKNLNLKPIKGKNISYQLGEGYLNNLESFTQIVRSPGIWYLTPQIQKAKEHGVIITSATQLFFDALKELKKRPLIIGITGTKGKGTVSTLIYEMLKAGKKKVLIAGNIGKPAIEVIKQAKKADAVVLELSSFQLQDIRTSPDVAVVLSISPDHQDVHEDMNEYVQAKAGITRNQGSEQAVFYVTGNELTAQIAKQSKGSQFPIEGKSFDLFTEQDLKIIGSHSYGNAIMAANVARYLGISDKAITKAATSFVGLPHRLQLVKTIKNKATKASSIYFYNDSLSTNPSTASAAVKALHIPIILIAGGKDAQFDYKPLAHAINESTVRSVVLYGENKHKIAEALRTTKITPEIVSTLADAVTLAYERAGYHSNAEQSSVAVILSPASKSFDMFKDYEDRGNQFTSFVKKLK